MITKIILTALLVLLIAIVVYALIQSRKPKFSVEITEQSLDMIGVLIYLGNYGNRQALNELQDVDDMEQLPYSSLIPSHQIMKSEFDALHARLVETVKFRDGSDFKAWTENRKQLLLRQIGAMALYHMILLERCMAAGIIIPKSSSVSE